MGERDRAARDILTALLPAIEAVDGYCCVCQENFVERANEGLAALGVSWRFRMVPWNREAPSDRYVEVVKHGR